MPTESLVLTESEMTGEPTKTKDVQVFVDFIRKRCFVRSLRDNTNNLIYYLIKLMSSWMALLWLCLVLGTVSVSFLFKHAVDALSVGAAVSGAATISIRVLLGYGAA